MAEDRIGDGIASVDDDLPAAYVRSEIYMRLRVLERFGGAISAAELAATGGADLAVLYEYCRVREQEEDARRGGV